MCECPYCLQEFDKQHVKYAVRNIVTARRANRNTEGLAPRLRRFLEAGNVKTAKDFEQLILEISDENNGRKTEDHANDIIIPGIDADNSLDADTYRLEITKQRNAYSILQNGQPVLKTREACPLCDSVLPEAFFEYEKVIKIGLAAGKGVGKTCFLVSLFTNLANVDPEFGGANRQLGYVLTSMMEENNPLTSDFMGMLKSFKDEWICPDPTALQNIPPVLLQLYYYMADGSEHKILVCIYDVAGEVVTGAHRGNPWVSHMEHMDGILYLIEPSMLNINEKVTPIHRKMRLTENVEKFFGNIRILSSYDQQTKQADRSKRPLSFILEDAIDSNKLGDNRSELNAQTEAVLGGLIEYIPVETLRNMHVALAIGKCDELQGNKVFMEYDPNGLSLNPAIDQNTMYMINKTIRRFISDRVLNPERFERWFKSCSYHLIAQLGAEPYVVNVQSGNKTIQQQRLGQGRFRPIRNEEPLLDLISRCLRDE